MVGGSQKKMKRPFYFYTDVRLFHFHDKPKAKFVCKHSFFFKDLENYVGYKWWWEMIMIMNSSSITRGYGTGSIGKVCRALKCMFIQLKVIGDHCYLYLSFWIQWKKKRKRIPWDLKMLLFFTCKRMYSRRISFAMNRRKKV